MRGKPPARTAFACGWFFVAHRDGRPERAVQGKGEYHAPALLVKTVKTFWPKRRPKTFYRPTGGLAAIF